MALEKIRPAPMRMLKVFCLEFLGGIAPRFIRPITMLDIPMEINSKGNMYIS